MFEELKLFIYLNLQIDLFYEQIHNILLLKRYTNADMNIYQYLRLHKKIIRQSFLILTLFTF